MARRVVVTGMGLVSPVGTGVSTAWKHLLDGRCGVVSLDKSYSDLKIPCLVGARVTDFDVDAWIPKSHQSMMSPFIQFALAAAKQALDHAGWRPCTDDEKARSGVAVGAGFGSLQDLHQAGEILYRGGGYRKLSPKMMPRILVNLAAGQISIAHDLRGPNHCVSTACATGAHSIGDAYRFIKFGDADVMVAGGTEAAIEPISVALFSRLRALATNFNDRPAEASRPFDRDRNGFVIGEGAGMLVLESLDHAMARNAEPLAEVVGYGLAGDAYHATAPAEDARGVLQVMRTALRSAELSPSSVDYVNAHATSTPLGDRLENKALVELFGQNKNFAVSSNKGAIGHMLGASGAAEAVFTIMSIVDQVVPPTLNLHHMDSDEFSLNYVPLQPQQRRVETALCNSFGFGGTNACLVFRRFSK
eukprot:gb/GEZN01006572.1/.p1 GENE.gb/GEZN01006572.1/~~gb/GEZN01006572.1/.p1  ORF type:complete len:418 (+),score=38.91 gb/GEZN01006572.1/:58-1311(+)